MLFSKIFIKYFLELFMNFVNQTSEKNFKIY